MMIKGLFFRVVDDLFGFYFGDLYLDVHWTNKKQQIIRNIYYILKN